MCLLFVCFPNQLTPEQDTYIQKAPEKLNYEAAFTSSVLKRIGLTKAINNELLAKSRQAPPWGQMDSREWTKTYVLAFKSFLLLCCCYIIARYSASSQFVTKMREENRLHRFHFCSRKIVCIIT